MHACNQKDVGVAGQEIEKVEGRKAGAEADHLLKFAVEQRPARFPAGKEGAAQ